MYCHSLFIYQVFIYLLDITGKECFFISCNSRGGGGGGRSGGGCGGGGCGGGLSGGGGGCGGGGCCCYKMMCKVNMNSE